MLSSALRDWYQANAKTTACPLQRYDGLLHLGTRRAETDIYAHHQDDYGYMADVIFDGKLIGRIERAATASIALLGAFQLIANRGGLELYTPTLPGHDVFTLEARPGYLGLTLRRFGEPTYVVLGAKQVKCAELSTWIPFCKGFEDMRGELNSIEALKRCVEFMDSEGMIL